MMSHADVRKVLVPFLHGAPRALTHMDIAGAHCFTMSATAIASGRISIGEGNRKGETEAAALLPKLLEICYKELCDLDRSAAGTPYDSLVPF